jgi:hypothetical protein
MFGACASLRLGGFGSLLPSPERAPHDARVESYRPSALLAGRAGEVALLARRFSDRLRHRKYVFRLFI